MRVGLLVLLAACADTAPSLGADDTAFCVTLGANLGSHVGALSVVALPSMRLTTNLLPGAVSGNPTIRAFGDKLYIVNRDAGDVTIVDTASPSGWAVEAKLATSSPEDVAVVGNKLYVATSTGVEVWNLDARSLSKLLDLASFHSGAGAPFVAPAVSIAVTGGRAYVTLPGPVGEVVVVDAATDQATGLLEMNYPSPSGQLVVRGATLLEATLAGSDGVDGCVEQISTDASPSVLPCLVKNAVLGGTVSAIAVESLATYLAVITFDAESVETGSLRAIDAEGSLAPQPLTAENEVVTDVAFAPSGHLVYADQAANGIRVYDLARRAEATTAAIGMGLPPVPSGGIVCLAR